MAVVSFVATVVNVDVVDSELLSTTAAQDSRGVHDSSYGSLFVNNQPVAAL